MEATIKDLVLEKWNHYFPGTNLPIGVFYSDELNGAEYVKKPADNPKGYTCIFAQMSKLRSGHSIAFDMNNLGCFGSMTTIFGGSYSEDQVVKLLVDIEHFKKDREQVAAMHDLNPTAQPAGRYLIMKPYDQLTEDDKPEIVCIFAKADVIAALHGLASFDDSRVDNVIVPFGSGCEGLLSFAFSETKELHPRAVLGGMDPAMRGCIKQDLLTFSVQHSRFCQMVGNMDNSFLNTYIWQNIKPRLAKTKGIPDDFNR